MAQASWKTCDIMESYSSVWWLTGLNSRNLIRSRSRRVPIFSMKSGVIEIVEHRKSCEEEMMRDMESKVRMTWVRGRMS